MVVIFLLLWKRIQGFPDLGGTRMSCLLSRGGSKLKTNLSILVTLRGSKWYLTTLQKSYHQKWFLKHFSWFRKPCVLSKDSLKFKEFVNKMLRYSGIFTTNLDSNRQPPDFWRLRFDNWSASTGVFRMSWVFECFKKTPFYGKQRKSLANHSFLWQCDSSFFGNTLNSLFDWNCEILNSFFVFFLKRDSFACLKPFSMGCCSPVVNYPSWGTWVAYPCIA